MEKRYQISGMTCTGCSASVEKQLNNSDKVEKATVDLETQEATVSFTAAITLGELQQLLPDKYRILEKQSAGQEPPETEVLKQKSKWQVSLAHRPSNRR